jgi:flagellar protein FliL
VPENIEKDVDQEEAPPPGKFPLKWILIGVVLLVVAGGGYVGWTLVKTDSEPAAEPSASNQKAPELEVGQTFSMDPFVVNLNEGGGKRYLKSKIELEYMEEGVLKELESRLPQMRDVILLHLSSKSLDEVQSVDGKIELKNALIKRINQILKLGKIRNLYFTQFVIQ